MCAALAYDPFRALCNKCVACSLIGYSTATCIIMASLTSLTNVVLCLDFRTSSIHRCPYDVFHVIVRSTVWKQQNGAKINVARTMDRTRTMTPTTAIKQLISWKSLWNNRKHIKVYSDKYSVWHCKIYPGSYAELWRLSGLQLVASVDSNRSISRWGQLAKVLAYTAASPQPCRHCTEAITAVKLAVKRVVGEIV